MKMNAKKKLSGISILLLVLCLLALVTSVSADTPLLFSPAVNYPVGSTPYSSVSGDFNLDGIPDLAVVNYYNFNVGILLGIGIGTFAPQVTYPVYSGGSPFYLATADFNKDTYLDLVSINPDFERSVAGSVLLGNGSGGFAAPINYQTSGYARSVAVGDFNLDTKPDIVVPNSDTNNLSVLLGNGSGGFAAAVNYPMGVQPNSVAVDDFNGDGKLDVVATASTDQVSVRLGIGDGTFAELTQFSIAHSSFVTTGDVNLDGHPDIVGAGSPNLGVLLGDGSGGFASGLTIPAGTATSGVVIGDINLDGFPDLAFADWNANNIGVLLGDGSGSFIAAGTYTTGSSPRSVTKADFNLDGKLDLATANNQSNNVSVFLNILPLSVSNILRADPNPAPVGSVDYIVTFTESVTGVDESDFTLTLSGTLTGTGISEISGSGKTYLVTVDSGTGYGTIRLDVLDDDTIHNSSGIPLGGVGLNNGDYQDGEVYDIAYFTFLPLIGK